MADQHSAGNNDTRIVPEVPLALTENNKKVTPKKNSPMKAGSLPFSQRDSKKRPSTEGKGEPVTKVPATPRSLKNSKIPVDADLFGGDNDEVEEVPASGTVATSGVAPGSKRLSPVSAEKPPRHLQEQSIKHNKDASPSQKQVVKQTPETIKAAAIGSGKGKGVTPVQKQVDSEEEEDEEEAVQEEEEGHDGEEEEEEEEGGIEGLTKQREQEAEEEEEAERNELKMQLEEKKKLETLRSTLAATFEADLNEGYVLDSEYKQLWAITNPQQLTEAITELMKWVEERAAARRAQEAAAQQTVKPVNKKRQPVKKGATTKKSAKVNKKDQPAETPDITE